jgi:hypothetical protein
MPELPTDIYISIKSACGGTIQIALEAPIARRRGVTFFIAKKVTKKGDPRREAPR